MITKLLREFTLNNKIFTKLSRSELRFRMLKSTLWSILGAVSNRGIMLIVSIVLARLLGTHTYGQYGMIRSAVNMFIVFAAFGIGTTATKYISEFRVKDPGKVERVLGLSVLSVVFISFIIFIFCFFGAETIANTSLNDASLVTSVRIAAFIIVVSAINGFMVGALNGFEAFNYTAKTSFFGAITGLLFICLLGSHWGLNGALLGFLIYVGASCFLYICFLKKVLCYHKIRVNILHSFREFDVIWKFSLPAILNGLIVAPIIWVGNLFLVNQLNGYEQMAIYDVCNQWRLLILFIPGIISQVALPMLSNLYGQRNQKGYKEVIWMNLIVNTSIAIIMACIIGCFSPLILEFYGEGFSEGVAIFLLLLVSAVVCVANGVVGQIIMSRGLAWYGLLFNLLWSICFVLIAFFLVRKYQLGATGLALSLVISYVFHSVWQGGYVIKILKSEKV